MSWTYSGNRLGFVLLVWKSPSWKFSWTDIGSPNKQKIYKMWQKQMSPWILICVPKSHLIFREREEKTKEKPLCWQISIVWFIVFLFIFSRQTTQHCVLGKSQAEKFTSEWLSHPSSCDSGEEWMPHLDTGHIERIYLGVSLFVCVPWAELLRDSSTDEMKSVLTGRQRKAFERNWKAERHGKSSI